MTCLSMPHSSMHPIRVVANNEGRHSAKPAKPAIDVRAITVLLVHTDHVTERPGPDDPGEHSTNSTVTMIRWWGDYNDVFLHVAA